MTEDANEENLDASSSENASPTEWRSRLPIIGKGSYSPNDIRNFHALLFASSDAKAGRKTGYLIIGAIILVYFVIVNVIEEQPLNPSQPPSDLSYWWPFVFVCLILVPCILRLVFLVKKSKKNMRQDHEEGNGRFELRTISVDENGIFDEATSISARFIWSAFTGISCNEELCALRGDVLTSRDISSWFLLPRRFFGDDDWETLQSLVQEKVCCAKN